MPSGTVLSLELRLAACNCCDSSCLPPCFSLLSMQWPSLAPPPTTHSSANLLHNPAWKHCMSVSNSFKHKFQLCRSGLGGLWAGTGRIGWKFKTADLPYCALSSSPTMTAKQVISFILRKLRFWLARPKCTSPHSYPWPSEGIQLLASSTSVPSTHSRVSLLLGQTRDFSWIKNEESSSAATPLISEKVEQLMKASSEDFFKTSKLRSEQAAACAISISKTDGTASNDANYTVYYTPSSTSLLLASLPSLIIIRDYRRTELAASRPVLSTRLLLCESLPWSGFPPRPLWHSKSASLSSHIEYRHSTNLQIYQLLQVNLKLSSTRV